MDTRPHIECQRCGKCCLVNISAILTQQDTARWKREQRDDILHVLTNRHAVWASDRLVSSQNEAHLSSCPFLKWEGKRASCTIYETRPGICREFPPGSSEICPQYRGHPRV